MKFSTIFRKLKIRWFSAFIVIIALCVSGCTEDSVSSYNSDNSLPPQHSLTWSPDGSMLAYIFDTYVVIQEPGTNNIRELTGSGFYYEPTWSPDSTKLAYSSSSYGARDDIYVKNADGSDIAMRLTRHIAADLHPRWSPDGEKIAFHSSRMGSMDIWIKNADGSGDEIPLTSDQASDLNAEWSPDSMKLAFESTRSENYDVWMVNADGVDPPVQITFDENQDRDPIWSPDGTRIAFQSDRGGSQGVWVKNADGTGEAIYISAGYTDSSMQKWSPDSNWIAFASEGEILVNRSDGTGVAEKIADGIEPCWSPDGAIMAVVAWTEDSRYRVQFIEVPEKFR